MPTYTQKTKATKNNTTAPSKQTEAQKAKLPKEVVEAIAAKNKNSSAAQQRVKLNSMKQNAKLEASKNKKTTNPRKNKEEEKEKKEKVNKAAQKKGAPAKPTSSISEASLILKPNKDVFKPIKSNTKVDIKLMKEPKSPELVVKMKGYHPGKMSDTDMGIKERYGKQATSDVLAAQQKGNPILKDIEKAKNATKPAEHHTPGLPKFITSAESGERFNTTTGGIDEGSFTKITTNIPERSKVTATEDSDKYQKGEEFYVDPAKMHAKHPSQKRMADMVTKVATYNMPNVKAAQKKYHK